MPDVLYVYAITRASHPLPDGVEAIDGSDRIAAVDAPPLRAIYSPVDDVDFSQPVIDAQSKNVEWLGAIGYRHQTVMNALLHGGTIIPLRAFTLFASEASLHAKLIADAVQFDRVLSRLDDKREWTLRIELEPQAWSEALGRRVDSLRALNDEIAQASAGKAFLLRKKLEDEKKRASREAEQQLVSEIEDAVNARLRCEVVAESRQQRGGAYPELNVLLARDEETVLQELQAELNARYAADGVTVALTGPWPPYTFAGLTNG